ncbi:hypothetical protein P9112_014698 [Eukaryota sp. TZLM1-RC]
MFYEYFGMKKLENQKLSESCAYVVVVELQHRSCFPLHCLMEILKLLKNFKNCILKKNLSVASLIKPKGKAAGSSGISFDILKIAGSSAPEIAENLFNYFQQLFVLRIDPPFELLAARLIVLVKPGNRIKPDGVRPIAVGESLSRDNNSIFNLDCKNAFNSVKGKAIFVVIKSNFPELSSFFHHYCGKASDLIFNSFGSQSSSGVKQGDPLRPLFFCLAIHKTLVVIKQNHSSLTIVAHMDDIFLIGSFDLLQLFAQDIADSYENIGLHHIASKCLLNGSAAQDLVIHDTVVSITNYSGDFLKFLGCWLENVR